tara:strand:+ start:285 stop:2192 length:1908 start_codon:yes stop_codon:yes gene_type:complete
MKIHTTHLSKFFEQDLDKNILSTQLFQLGHENEVKNDTIDIDLTPNRGDCLSLLGISRELNVFYKGNYDLPIYENEIELFDFDFKNYANLQCPRIFFLNISVKDLPDSYIPEVESYFKDLNIKKNNFFTDISNYVAYEMGQPTHCYDSSMIDGSIILSEEKTNETFLNLLDQEINLSGKNLVFRDSKNIINLAGIIGGKKTSCNIKTKDVIVESAYFNPESIIGKSVKYNINSEAAHKFERGVDPLMQEKALRRFIFLVEQHSKIQDLKIYRYISKDFKNVELESNVLKINEILGTDVNEKDYFDMLSKLGFIVDKKIFVPSYRSDINHENDLAEEVARVIGYDQIKPIEFKSTADIGIRNINETKLKHFLVDNGFFEVINMPFSDNSKKDCIRIDNPLDINKNSFRSDISSSLISNLDFNEKRQKDSIKLFEISDIYSLKDELVYEKKFSMLVSGRQGHNYLDFNKKLDEDYLVSLFRKLDFDIKTHISSFDRQKIDSKIKNPIFLIEIRLDELIDQLNLDNVELKHKIKFKPYEEISEYPSTYRDISFAFSDSTLINKLENIIEKYENIYLKESFVFDYYHDAHSNRIKLGFRFIFQHQEDTLTDETVDIIMDEIIKIALTQGDIEIPGLHKK